MKVLYVSGVLITVWSVQAIILSVYKSQGRTHLGYTFSSSLFVSELGKFLISILMQKSQDSKINLRLDRETITYSLPALIYFTQNMVSVTAALYVDAATYILFGNLKIVTTGILYHFTMGKPLTRIQWLATILLNLGVATSQIPDCSKDSFFNASLIGIFYCVVLAFLSPVGGITTEYIMKKTALASDSLAVQNTHLYFFGMVVGLIGHFVERKPGMGFLEGWDWIAVAATSMRIIAGLLVSIIIKKADNMVKVFAISVSMFTTVFLSYLLFDYQLTIPMMYGIVIVTISIILYFGLYEEKDKNENVNK